ncbi:MAG: fluoride efflux transporter CrcB [Dehalococcoidia bacterium]|nr:fluoride efflux transporter CrcB [Dehalococcoidia bacterium]
MTYAWIVAGAAVGAPLRYFLQTRMHDGTSVFPVGTVVLNLTGCFVIGVMLTLAEERSWLSREARLLLVTGLLGSYTTFSTFGWETYALLRENEFLRAGWYVGLSVFAGVLGVWLGVISARIAFR